MAETYVPIIFWIKMIGMDKLLHLRSLSKRFDTKLSLSFMSMNITLQHQLTLQQVWDRFKTVQRRHFSQRNNRNVIVMMVTKSQDLTLLVFCSVLNRSFSVHKKNFRSDATFVVVLTFSFIRGLQTAAWCRIRFAKPFYPIHPNIFFIIKKTYLQKTHWVGGMQPILKQSHYT